MATPRRRQPRQTHVSFFQLCDGGERVCSQGAHCLQCRTLLGSAWLARARALSSASGWTLARRTVPTPARIRRPGPMASKWCVCVLGCPSSSKVVFSNVSEVACHWVCVRTRSLSACVSCTHAARRQWTHFFLQPQKTTKPKKPHTKPTQNTHSGVERLLARKHHSWRRFLEPNRLHGRRDQLAAVL